LRLNRLVRQEYARHALAGSAGLEADGRRHSAGRQIVYLASSEALAVLEVRVHLGSIVPAAPYQILSIECPDRLVVPLPARSWPRQWQRVPFHPATQQLGDAWLAGAASAALRVPSVRSASDFNVLLNPGHPDAGEARVVGRRRYRFDERPF
jgi:RES domain-containing protein